jgi:hypothetical protein
VAAGVHPQVRKGATALGTVASALLCPLFTLVRGPRAACATWAALQVRLPALQPPPDRSSPRSSPRFPVGLVGLIKWLVSRGARLRGLAAARALLLRLRFLLELLRDRRQGPLPVPPPKKNKKTAS